MNRRTKNIENPNDLWGHAIPLEGKRKELDLIAEAKYMRELYMEFLPGDSDKSSITSYFDRLDEAIKNGVTPGFDEFDDKDRPDSEPRDYRYYSATVLKERASQYSPLSCGENVDSADYVSGPWSPTPDQHSVTPPLSPVSECKNTETSEDAGN